MRVTNTTIARNYTSSLNKNLQALNKSYKRVYGTKYSTMAENTSNGVRAMNVRRNLAKVESYIDNTKNTQSVFTAAESSLMQISSLTHEIRELYTSADDGENSEQLGIIATKLTRYREELITLANSQYSDRFLFGGTNTNSPPFSLDDDNNLLYNGVKVSDIAKGVVKSTDEDGNEIETDYTYLFEDAAYIDLGLGMTMKSGTQNQNVLENTAFKNTIVGLDVLGFGSENIINVLQDMIDSLSSGEYNAEINGPLLERFIAASDNVGVAVTQLGADTQYLDFTLSRLTDQRDNLIEQQQNLEFADPYEAIMDWEMQDYIYNAALQMGSRLLQPTLFDFIR